MWNYLSLQAHFYTALLPKTRGYIKEAKTIVTSKYSMIAVKAGDAPIAYWPNSLFEWDGFNCLVKYNLKWTIFLMFVAMEIVYFTILYSTNSWVLHSIKTKNIYKRHTTVAITRWWNSQQDKSCTPEGVPTTLSPTPGRRSRSLRPSGLPSKWKPSRWQVPQRRRHTSRVPIDGTVWSKEPLKVWRS